MRRQVIKSGLSLVIPLALIALTAFAPELLFAADLATNLGRVQRGLLNTVLPAIGTLGLVWGAISFVSGNPAGRGHLIMGVIGLIIGFLAPSIVNFIQSMFGAGVV
jgi:hypothetical protein